MNKSEDGGWAFWLFMAWIVLASAYAIATAIISPESGGYASRDEIEYIR